MNHLLSRFEIVGLHGNQNIDASIRDNTLILVGENGSGKTTFLRFIFYFLSGKWSQLLSFPFNYVLAEIGGKEFKVTHDELTKGYVIDKHFLSGFPPSHRRRILDQIRSGNLDSIYEELGDYSRNILYSDKFSRDTDLLEKLLNDSPSSGFKEKKLEIQNTINSQILYLPTYRRIERELGSIFEGVDPEDLHRQRKLAKSSESGDAHIELVEFGMKDVQQAVDRTLNKLKEFARTSLNELTLGYLSDVVSRSYENIQTIEQVSEENVIRVLDRIQESVMSEAIKKDIYSVIQTAKSEIAPNAHQKIIYHYFLKLLRFQQTLQEKERQISIFCELCSEYIVNKRFIYNGQTFSFSIIPTEESQTDRTITLSDLSSGEKQIVSLFSHLHLSAQNNFFILIDEPELSLSVPWQRRFLQDIHRGKFCKGLIAVTHSPFIYDNNLRDYTHSMGEFSSN